MYDYFMSIKRPRDNEPDDRDVDPDKYLYYIQRHGKECDRIEPQLNGLFVKTKDIESPETPFVKGSNYFFYPDQRKNYQRPPSDNFRRYDNGNLNEDNKMNMNRNKSQIYRIERTLDNNIGYNNPYIGRELIDTNKNNYIKDEPMRSQIIQKHVRYKPYKLDKNHYDDIYYNPRTYLTKKEIIGNYNEYKNRLDSPLIDQNIDLYPENLKKNSYFKIKEKNENYLNNYQYNKRYDSFQNDDDSYTRNAISQTLPNYQLNESKTNNVNRFNYNAQEHSDYRRYSPYTNHYGENKNYFF